MVAEPAPQCRASILVNSPDARTRAAAVSPEVLFALRCPLRFANRNENHAQRRFRACQAHLQQRLALLSGQSEEVILQIHLQARECLKQ